MSLLGFLGNVAGGFLTGGPVGAIAGGAMSLLGPKAAKPPVAVNIGTALAPATRYSAPVPQFSNPAVPQFPPLSLPGAGQVQIDSTRTSGVSLFPGGPMVGTQTTYSSPAAPPGMQGCPPKPGCGGWHLNRSSYVTSGPQWAKKLTYIPKGSKWVKNRRRNPLNPRALSRGMSRIHSAKRAAHFLERIHIGPKRARRK